MGLACIFCFSISGMHGEETAEKNKTGKEVAATAVDKKQRLAIGGYGEAIMTRNFFSDSYLRYSSPQAHANDKSHGRFDLPHVVLSISYDFGKGWSMSSEIEFEHGGTGSAVEMEEEEGGEYESEIERGGEVVLEQFWIQKSFCPQFNLRLGHIIVPVGGTNQHHLPTEFFGVYRPEGENTILPCTWHETGISLWGIAGQWRYEVLFLPGLDSDRFSRQNWIQGGAGSPYEFKIANAYAGAFRVDNYSIPGLRMGLSGYAGNSFSNSLTQASSRYDGVKGTVMIGAFDLTYDAHNLVIRGSVDYGHLTNSADITKRNQSMRSDSPSPKQAVASDAISGGLEIGYNFFGLNSKLTEKKQKFYVFTRYDYYDSMFRVAEGVTEYPWCERQRMAAGINYYPIKDIVIKGEYAIGLLKAPFNNEPTVSIGVAYAGFFTK